MLSTPLEAADFSGSVVSVLDGDTIEVLHYRQPLRPSLIAALSVKIQGIPLAA
jgi:endonuclease YncB( thermonuclease family)